MTQLHLVEYINLKVRIARDNGLLKKLEERLRPFLVLWIVIAAAGIYFHW